VIRRHERAYADIRRHLRLDHGVQAGGVVKLSTYIRHRTLHAKAKFAGPPHDHEARPECAGRPADTLCPCHHTHGEKT
jgi:hypothetical protein